VDVPKDDPSRYLLGLVGGGGSIRVQRADMVSVAAVREAHAQAVIRAWTASRILPATEPMTASWRTRVRRRLRSAAHRLR
jgi:hypothetical protein